MVPVLTRRPAAFCLIDAAGQTGTAVFGIVPGALQLPDSVPAGAAVNFEVCDASFRR